ncbi:succinate dehydrogenase [candidate division KSB1 bacterium]|nr:succinate dehydrogenase [candidate division KSB1 bacterium]
MGYSQLAGVDRFGATRRLDTWWLSPALMAAAFVAFVIYATWAAFQPVEYSRFGPYLSPFYSPDLTQWIPWFTWSPALLIVWLPAGFRLTCYYGRKAYYRSITLNPTACAVGEGKLAYKGETALPWILNNLHRYFLYLVLILVVFHWLHLFHAFVFDEHFGMALGSLVITADTVFLTLYVFSCHSLRHMVGGKLDCFSCAASGLTRHATWKQVSALNIYHNVFFWCSLFTVGFADLYVRMCAMGCWTDVRFF